MASSAVAGVASSTVAEVASSAVIVEVASSTDSVGFVDSLETFELNCESDCLATNVSLENCDDMVEVVPLEEHELGGLTDVVPPVLWGKVLLSILWSVANTVRVTIGHR